MEIHSDKTPAKLQAVPQAERGALSRGLKIVDLLMEVEFDPVRQRTGLSVQQAAMELGVHKSTASRLIQELVESGYAVPNPNAKRGFRLGPALRHRRTLSASQQAFREAAAPFLQRLVGLTQECAHAAVPMGESALVVDAFETWKALRVVATKGRSVPLHCTSAGKVLLAFGMAEVPADLPARTSRTLVDRNVLLAHLNEIRERGWALDDEENHGGVRCISAPVFAGEGNPIGCIGIDGPRIRLRDEALDELATHVENAATEFSATLAAKERRRKSPPSSTVPHRPS